MNNTEDLQLHKQHSYQINEWKNNNGVFGLISDNATVSISYSNILNGTAYLNVMNNSKVYSTCMKNEKYADSVVKVSKNSRITNIISGMNVAPSSFISHVSVNSFYNFPTPTSGILNGNNGSYFPWNNNGYLCESQFGKYSGTLLNTGDSLYWDENRKNFYSLTDITINVTSDSLLSTWMNNAPKDLNNTTVTFEIHSELSTDVNFDGYYNRNYYF